MVVQLAAAWIAILLTSGGGSFVGLFVMLLALLAVPATAIVNLVTVRAHPDWSMGRAAMRSFLVALVFPGAIFALYALQILLEYFLRGY